MAFLFPKVVNQIPKKGKIKKKNLSSIVKMINIFEKRIYHKNLFHPHQKKPELYTKFTFYLHWNKLYKIDFLHQK